MSEVCKIVLKTWQVSPRNFAVVPSAERAPNNDKSDSCERFAAEKAIRKKRWECYS